MSDDWLVQIMIAHGHTDEAISYLMRDTERKFPFGMVPVVLQHAADETVRLKLLRRAIEAWRTTPRDDRFIRMFQSQWKALPPDEALTVAREIVAVTHDQPELPISATYADGAIKITSRRAHNLFLILDALRSLDPPLAQSLIHKHKQLAQAAGRFPNGLQSIREEGEARRPPTPRTTEGGYGILGSPRDFPYIKSLIQATRDGDFGPPLDHALERFREDTDRSGPNRAPRECWPSTEAFRTILYSAGKRLGRDAAIYLDRIPDTDLRLFAQIELAAALAGLPELRGLQMESRTQ